MNQAIGSNNADAVVALSPHDEPVAKLDFTWIVFEMLRLLLG
jgi:hypothetical protein